MNRIRLLTTGVIFTGFLVVSVFALTLVGVQVLKAPRVQAPTVHLFCTGSTLLNFTDPSPLLPSSNGTIVYGCGASTGGQSGLTPALAISSTGIVQPTFSLPANVTIYLVPNTGVISGPMSQSQCAATGVVLTSSQNVTIPVGSYSYCESFNTASSLVSVTVAWYEA